MNTGWSESLASNIFTGRGECREQFEVGYPCPEMNSNAARVLFGVNLATPQRKRSGAILTKFVLAVTVPSTSAYAS